MRKTRNFKKEYLRRIAAGLTAGKSRSAARGHPKAADIGSRPASAIDRNAPVEKALARMRHGESQRAAATAEGVSAEKLRAFLKLNTVSRHEGGSWVISDQRPQQFWIASRGQLKPVTVANELGSEIGTYWNAVDKFLNSNIRRYLLGFVGKGVRDVQGRFHPYETDPNTLRRLDSIGELHFIEIYADVAE
jgi:hypothetical protein